MRSLTSVRAGAAMGLAVAVVASAPAFAGIVNVDVSQVGTVTAFHPDIPGYTETTTTSNVLRQYNISSQYGQYANIQLAANVGGDHIDFANNVTTTGIYNYATTTSTVAITYLNDTGHTTNGSLKSQVTPAGFGFYQADLAGNPTQQDGNPLDVNQTGEGAYGFGGAPFSSHYADLDTVVGTVSISFLVKNGLQTLAEYSQEVTLHLTGATPDHGPTGSYISVDHLTNTLGPLDGYTQIAADDPFKAMGYLWRATDFIVPLGELADGESSTISYITTVSARTVTAGYNAASGGGALLAYAGFGDPIGGDAGANGIADPNFPQLMLSLPDFDPLTGDITTGKFQGYEPALPITEIYYGDPDGTGQVHSYVGPSTYQAPFFVTPAPSGAPEPGPWALMLGGFGLMGAALRRRARPRFA